MLVLFGILIIISSIILGFIILIQNPKGGGLSGTFGGVGNQLMGVKQTTNALEKGTWIFAAVVGILCIISPAFIPSSTSGGTDMLNEMRTTPTSPATPQGNQLPANTAPMPGSQALPDSN